MARRRHRPQGARRRDQALGVVMRRRLSAVLHVGGMALALILIAGASHEAMQRALAPGTFPIEQIEIKGWPLHQVSQDDLQHVVGSLIGHNLLALPLQQVRTRLLENAWLASVTVERIWPATLRLELREHRPFSHWAEREVLATDGQRIAPHAFRRVQTMPRLSGAVGREQQVMEAYMQATNIIAELELEVAELHLDQRLAWILVLSNGLQLHLGRESIDIRLQRFVDVYPQVLASRVNSIHSIDLRYESGFAVRWKVTGEQAPEARNINRGRSAHGA